MDEGQPEQAAEPEAAEPAAAPEASTAPPKPSRTARVKSGSEAVMAVIKTALLVATIVLVSVVATIVIWRDLHSRVVLVDVSVETEKTLRSLGMDVNLRQAVLDALNERLDGVRQIVEAQGLQHADDGTRAADISFKSFGLQLSTSDITRLVDLVFDRPPPPSVRLELLCAPPGCEDPAPRGASLVANLSSPNGWRSASYPLALGSFALRRDLQQTVQRIADLMLEQNDPLIASVLFMNRASSQDVFFDQALPDLVRAAGDAVAGRLPGEAGCLSDLVFGPTLARRGELADGIAVEQRAADSGNMVCKVHAETNIILLGMQEAWCARNPAERDAAHQLVMQALDRLPKQRPAHLDDLVWFRIPAAELQVAVMQLLAGAGEEVRQATCFGGPPPRTGPPGVVAEQVRKSLDDVYQKMPPGHAPPEMQHGLLALLWHATQVGVPSDDLAGRLSNAIALMQATNKYEASDQHPRTLFYLRGQLAMAIARAAFEAQSLTPDQKVALARKLGVRQDATPAQIDPMLNSQKLLSLNAAVVAFENAVATTALAPLVEPVTDVEILGSLGDAFYVVGAAYGEGADRLAREAYARALDRFFAAGEPVEQVLTVSDILARWASLRITAGACDKDARPDHAWDDRWARVGDPTHDVCQLARPDDGNEPPASIEQLVRVAVTACPPAQGQADRQAVGAAAFKQRFAALECHAAKGANDPDLRSRLSAEAVDAAITRQLSTAKQ